MESPEQQGWPRGWEEHKLEQLVRMSKLSMAEKLQWLEDMHILYENMQKGREAMERASDSSPPLNPG